MAIIVAWDLDPVPVPNVWIRNIAICCDICEILIRPSVVEK
jgi:hypothetical protein